MNNFLRIVGICSFFCGIGCGSQGRETLNNLKIKPDLVFASKAELTNHKVVRGSYIVAFKTNMASRFLRRKDYSREYQSHYLRLAHLERYDTGVKELHYITSLNMNGSPSFFRKKVAGPPQFNLEWNGFGKDLPASLTRVEFSNDEKARELLGEWYKKGLIFYAEPNYTSQMSQSAQSFSEYKAIYEGIESVAPWLAQIELVKALETLAGNGSSIDEQPLIAVMDSGLDYTHPSLEDKVWINPDPNSSGCTDDLHGCDTTKSFKGSLGQGSVEPVGIVDIGDSCPEALVGVCDHGTHVAGLIAAEPSSDGGFGGVCPMCKIIAIKIVGTNALGEGKETNIADSSIIAGLTYVSRFHFSSKNAIRVINASFGKFQRSRSVEHLVRLLREKDNGIVVVAAAGNEDSMKRQYPAAFNDALGVVNVNSEENQAIKAESSNFGIWADIAAPGQVNDSEGLLSTVPGGFTDIQGGTSMATPVVSGVIGLLLVSEPEISIDGIRSRLLATADPSLYTLDDNQVYIPSIKGEPNPVPLLGQGVINAFNVLSSTEPTQRPRPAFARVTSSCGVVSGKVLPQGVRFFMIVLLMPLLLTLIPRRWSGL